MESLALPRMTGAMGGFRGFLCTHQEMNVTVIYRWTLCSFWPRSMKVIASTRRQKKLFLASLPGLLDISGWSLTCSASYFFKSKDLLGGSEKYKMRNTLSLCCLGWKVENVLKKRSITVWPHFLLLEKKIFPLFCKCVAFSWCLLNAAREPIVLIFLLYDWVQRLMLTKTEC